MSSNINSVSISGNLTRDSELRSANNGTAILNFSVAVNDRRKVGDEWQDVPNYIDCVVFGPRAVSLERYLTKGTKVSLEGKLRYSDWMTKEGVKRSKVEVAVEEIEFMSARRRQQDAEQQQAPAKAEDIPF